MDKYEYKVKLAQIEKLVKKKDYMTAAEIADGIDWRKVKSARTLSMIADIYEETERLEDCYEILNMVYDRSPVARSIVYRMAEIAARMHDFEEAIDLYKEFVRIAPHDLSKYILKYQIYRERGSSVADQIVILEEFKDHEYNEKWAYELACLYEEAGMIDRCIEECDELILWFSEGEYVVKAMELKMKYQPLTAAQQEKYDHRFEFADDEDAEEEDGLTIDELTETETAEENIAEAEEEPQTETAEIEELAEKLESLVEILPEAESTAEAAEEVLGAENAEEITAEAVEEVSAKTEESQEEVAIEAEEVTEAAPKTAEEMETETETEAGEADTPVVSEVNTDKFSTLNLQAELAKGLELIMAQVRQEMPEDDALLQPETEVGQPAEEEKEETAEQPALLSETAELQTELLKYSQTDPQPDMDSMLREEEDGQIGLDIEEDNILEKQITGQMTIEEILEAWEEKKRLAKEAIVRAEEKKKSVLCETGEITSILDDFMPRTAKDICLPEEEEEEEEEASGAETTEAAADPETEEGIEDDLPQEIGEEFDLEEEEAAKPKRPVSDTESMLDAIEKALSSDTEAIEPSSRYMTDEEEKIFAYFTQVKGMKKQLLTLLEEDASYEGREDSADGNLVITGHPGNGKTTLAIDIVKAFQKQRRVKGGKLAKVTGDGMNKKDPFAVLKKLGGGALIIEHAGALNSEAVRKLSKAMAEKTGGVLVILEDSAAEIRRLLSADEGFARKFNRAIDIPIFSNDELVAFGRSYAEEEEYYFDEMAVLALYDSIGIRQTSNHVVNITEVKELVDHAISHAEKKSRGLFARFSKKRIDEYGNRLLLEEDFDE